MTTYKMTVIANGTRLRKDHNTFAALVASYPAGAEVEGVEFWDAPADGTEVKARDRWLKVNKVDGVNVPAGWMAFTHKGVPVCRDWVVVTDTTPPSAPIFPESYTLVAPDGSRAFYTFVRVLP